MKNKIKNWPKGGVALVTWPTSQILVPSWYLWNGWRYKSQILHVDWSKGPDRPTKQKNSKLVKTGMD